MSAPGLGTYLHRLRQSMAADVLAACPDGELVSRVRSGEDEAAFRAVLSRHGQMVYQVCRRVLSSDADVEDAFQATFLILLRRGHTLRQRSSLASWLHGVAHRAAVKLRTEASRRRRREGRVARTDTSCLSNDATWGEVRSVLDEELGRLPMTYRGPLVLCYLEGRTQDEAAAQLGLSKSTLRRQLDRGRALLGRRLARRGLALAAAMAARLLSDCAQGAVVPRALLMRTAGSASHPPAGLAAPAGVLSARVAALTEGVAKTMCYTKYKAMAAVLACGLVMGLGLHQFGLGPATAQEKSTGAGARPTAAAPDIEPIDPNLVFDPEVQKELRLSPNQVRRLSEARDKGGAAAADQAKRAVDLDERIKKLQEEIDRLQREKLVAREAVHKSQAGEVRAAIPTVLSREAVARLRQMTVQRMRLTDVLLDAKVRARLGLDDEQVRKIQELADKGGSEYPLHIRATPRTTTVELSSSRVFLGDSVSPFWLSKEGATQGRAELLKVLTPDQRRLLERLAGTNLDK